MSIPATIEAMRAAGVPDDKIVETVLALAKKLEIEAITKIEERRAKDVIRKRRQRHADSAMSRDVTRTGADTVGQKKVSPTPPSKKTTTPGNNPPSGDILPAPTPRSELERVVSAERAAAVIEHRQRLRKPLTAHAAKLLAGKFAKAPDPNAAADAMVANGWLGFELEWLAGRQRRDATGPPREDRQSRIQAAIQRTRADLDPTDRQQGDWPESPPRDARAFGG